MFSYRSLSDIYCTKSTLIKDQIPRILSNGVKDKHVSQQAAADT